MTSVSTLFLCSQPFFQSRLHIETCDNIQVVLYLYVSLPNGLVRLGMKFCPIPSFFFFKSRCSTFINQILDPALYFKYFTFKNMLKSSMEKQRYFYNPFLLCLALFYLICPFCKTWCFLSNKEREIKQIGLCII